MSAPAFTGIPADGLRFLSELTANNNRDWFEAHRADYETLLRDPAVALVVALGERIKSFAPGVIYDTRTNGSGSLMRINRDIRFSKDKSPYKTRIAMLFWEGAGKKMQHPAFGLQFGPEGVGLMAGLFSFSKPMLNAYRDAVVDDRMGAALNEAVAAVRAAGHYEIRGEAYKTVPRGYPADHPRAELLKHAGLWASPPELPPDAVLTADFVDGVGGHFERMAPVQRWLVGLEGWVKD
jgi:uncharacterized protein (TIGR02453 family)